MKRDKNTSPLSSRVIKTEDVKWSDLKFLQDDNFKSLTPERHHKLKNSILVNQFSEPFYVWLNNDDGHIYCLNGKHRIDVLHELTEENYQVPDYLPATFIQCNDMQQAAKLVLIYSSFYAQITDDGLIDFMQVYSLSLEDIKMDVNFPELNLQSVIGDQYKDFSTQNEELNIDSFKDEVVLKLTFPRQEYIEIKQRISALMAQNSVNTPEDLIKLLIK